MNDLLRAALAITACPQCNSLYCGPYRCRFSGVTNDDFFWNQGTELVKRDQETPAWLRALKTGEKESQ